jgi:putative hydrolase of the HAD superfamily
VAGVLAILVTLFLLARYAVAGRMGRPPRATRPPRTSRRAGEILEEYPADGGEAGERRLELLVLGGIGVIWDSGGDPEGLLVRYVREQGGIADPREIADRYRSASLGHVSTAQFWSSIGVKGEADQLDRSYLERVKLRRDVLPFLDRMKERGLPVACLTNAVLPWSVFLREHLGLDELMAHWVVSGEVGARKPSQAMFEALRRMSGVPFRNMLLIDSEPPMLEAARSMGMSTVLMRGAALIPEGFPHPVIGGFAELFRPSTKAAPAEYGASGGEVPEEG